MQIKMKQKKKQKSEKDNTVAEELWLAVGTRAYWRTNTNEEATNSAKKINVRDMQYGGRNATKTNQQWRANQHERACFGLPSLWSTNLREWGYHDGEHGFHMFNIRVTMFDACSLMESIISRRPNRTKGTPEEASTEGIDVRPGQLENTSIEFYDCAGQVDYGGMHQVFLTQRALFLLVWDITRCSGLSDGDLDEVSYW